MEITRRCDREHIGACKSSRRATFARSNQGLADALWNHRRSASYVAEGELKRRPVFPTIPLNRTSILESHGTGRISRSSV